MKFLVLALSLFVANCTKVYVPTTGPSDTYYAGSTNTTGTVNGRDTIEFRVLGNASSAQIRFNNSLDGLVQTQAVLPFVTSITSTRDNIFLSLEATPTNYSVSTVQPFLSVQIYVNGILFREATSSSFLLNTLTVNGTFRRN